MSLSTTTAASTNMSPSSSSVSQRLARGDRILIDGGTGTELELRQVPMNQEAWTAAACLTHPEVVQAIHQDYIDAGAELIIANTYACSQRLLSDAGLEDQFEHLNRLGIEIAQQAAAKAKSTHKKIIVAGSISTTDLMKGHPDPDSVREGYRRQAELQAAAGADLLILEMMREKTHTLIALEGAKSVGLPVWVGLSCIVKEEQEEEDNNGNGDTTTTTTRKKEVYLFDGKDKLSDVLMALKEQGGVELVAIMHTLTQDVDACLDVVEQYWDGYVGVYAHSGRFVPPNWQFLDMISPKDYAENCERWFHRNCGRFGVQVIGGCCGIRPTHIRELHRRWPQMTAPKKED